MDRKGTPLARAGRKATDLATQARQPGYRSLRQRISHYPQRNVTFSGSLRQKKGGNCHEESQCITNFDFCCPAPPVSLFCKTQIKQAARYQLHLAYRP